MRPTAARLATAAASSPSTAATAPLLALLPPIPLYRRLFRAHRRHLPADMRLLGDKYVKAEFRAHRHVDNPAHLVGSSRPPPLSRFSILFCVCQASSLLSCLPG